MNDTIVLTSIYSEFWGTEQFRKSCNRVGLPIYNAFNGTEFTGNGSILKMLYGALQLLKDKYKYVIYSDGADTFFAKSFTPPNGVFVISGEKNCYPDQVKAPLYPTKESSWCYVNGGNWCGEITLIIEFFERYGLLIHKNDANGQRELTDAYIKAYHDHFPIILDQKCVYFQTTAFEEPGDFTLAEDGKGIINNITGTEPCVFHGNGRTDMKAIYERYNLK
jgi:hypothetical protein